jgi:hypothetical protein
MSLFDKSVLTKNGLSLHAIFDVCDLPSEIYKKLNTQVQGFSQYKQLILIGHSGKRLWKAMQEAGFHTDNPIDDFTIRHLKRFFTDELPNHTFSIIYPSSKPINLQKLGELAGWHHDSPLRIGVNDLWGSWFAYRAVILTDTQLSTTQKLESTSPCLNCKNKPCITSCPADAITTGSLDLDRCISYRKRHDSSCKDTCHARTSCPVAKEQAYTTEQVNYHYEASMKLINSLQ